MTRANSYDVLITAVDTVQRPDGKSCVKVTWLDPATPSNKNARGSARTVPGSTATRQSLAAFHGAPERRVDIILNGRSQIIAIRDHLTGDLIGE